MTERRPKLKGPGPRRGTVTAERVRMAPRPPAGRGEIWARLWQTKPHGTVGNARPNPQGTRNCRENPAREARGGSGRRRERLRLPRRGRLCRQSQKEGPQQRSGLLRALTSTRTSAPSSRSRRPAGGASCASGAQASPPPTRPEPHGRYERREAFPLRAENTKELGSTNIIPGENDPTRTTNGKRGVMC